MTNGSADQRLVVPIDCAENSASVATKRVWERAVVVPLGCVAALEIQLDAE